MEQIHILLVDDEIDILKTMTTILEMEQYKVSTAINGKEALQFINSQKTNCFPVDILVTDIAMPELDGVGLVTELRRQNNDIPIIAVTGYGSKKSIVDLIHKGVAAYIDKPFKMNELTRRINIVADTIIQKRREKKEKQTVLTERETRIQTLQQQLAQSQEFEILGKLSSGIAHDFNNMLTAISGYAELIQDKEVSDEDPKELLEKYQYYGGQITKAAKTSQNTIKQLQAFARGDEEQFSTINIHDVIMESVKIANGAVGRNVSVETELLAENPFIAGDRSLLHNAFVNLFINARDAMPQGGTITVSSREDVFGPSQNSVFEITVKDTGIGMDEETQQKVFEPFFTTKGKKGNGLGLASVLSTIDKHGGKIECDSTPGQGTEFLLSLPQTAHQSIVNKKDVPEKRRTA